MDWTNNGSTRPAQQSPTGGSGAHKKKLSNRLSDLKLTTIALALAAIVIVGVVFILASGNKSGKGVLGISTGSGESSFVNDDNLQAVFLNGGQVYFGKIDDLNDNFLRMSNIYYLRVNQAVQPDQQAAGSQQQTTANDISLVKLGCELHGPQDEMLINRDQVVFWENLKGDGQVAKAVDEYVKANPNGQQCNTSTQQSNTNNTTTPTTTTPTTTTPATRR